MNLKQIRLSNMLMLMDIKNISQKDFADRVGSTPSELSQIKNPKHERNIGDNLAKRIETEFGLPEYWMSTQHDFQRMDLNKLEIDVGGATKNAIRYDQIGDVSSWDSKTPLGEDDIEVPYYMDVELSAGHGNEGVYEDKGLKLRFGKSFLRRKNVNVEKAACVRISGDSMEPKLSDGDLVAINTGDTKIHDGKTYAINHDGLLRVKKLYLMPGGGVRISSVNKEEYPDEILTVQDRQLLEVIGVVFHSQSEDW